MTNAPLCKAHHWHVPNSGEEGIALVECQVCHTPQYQPLDGLRETVARANKLNKKHHYPLILVPGRVNHWEPLADVPKEPDPPPIKKEAIPVRPPAPVEPVRVVSTAPVKVKRKQKYATKGIRGNHRWTEEEQDMIRLCYDGTRASVDKLMKMIGCSRYGVKGQVAFLGLAHSKQPEWTDKELHYLKTHYQKESVRVMAHALGRSMNAVKVKATRLHFSLRARDGWFSKTEVCEMLGVDHHMVQRWIDSGELKASYHTGRKPSQKGMAMWHIVAADLRDMVVNHCQELQGRNIDLCSILVLCGVLPEKVPGKKEAKANLAV